MVLTRETSADFQALVSARVLEVAAELPAASREVVEGLVLSAGEDLRRTLVEACAGHAPSAALPPVVTHFAVRMASIVELLHLASVLHDDLTVSGLAAKEAAQLGSAVKEAVAATAARGERPDVQRQLFSLACVLGGQVAGRSTADLDVLARFGIELGTAVQALGQAGSRDEADAGFLRALAQLDELSDEQARERIVAIARGEWVKL
jgi:hypothetical protein